MTWVLYANFYTVLIIITSHFVDGRMFKMGVLLPLSGNSSVHLSEDIISYTNRMIEAEDSNLSLLRRDGHNFTLEWADTRCDEGLALREMVTMVTGDDPVDVIIGPACDASCITTALLAAQLGIPIISYGCGAAILPDKSRYSTFARTLASDTAAASAITRIMLQYNWRKTVVIYSSDTSGVIAAHAYQEKMTSEGVSVSLVPVQTGGSVSQIHQNMRDALITARSKAYVVILYMDSKSSSAMISEAANQGMFRGQYILLTVRQADYILTANQAGNEYQGLLDIGLYKHDTGEDNMDHSPHKPVSDVHSSVWCPDELCSQSANHQRTMDYLLWDAMQLYVAATYQVISAGLEPDNRTAIMQYIFNQSFTGSHGPVVTDEYGDATSDYVLRILNNDTFIPLMYFMNSCQDLFICDHPVVWSGGATYPPTEAPSCGWRGLSCTLDLSLLLGVIGIFLGLLIGGVVICKVYKHQRRFNQSRSMTWRIVYDDITMRSRRSRSLLGSNLSKDTFTSVEDNKAEEQSMTSQYFTIASAVQQQVFAQIGFYGGRVVAIKNLRKKYICLNNEVISEMNEIRRLQHGNVNQVLGACVEPNHICVVSVYCNKGSLQDVLGNEDIRLDRIFKISFASDIAQGMVYLHDSIIQFHGNLKSSNVLIDSRWSCRLADYGLRKFREGERKLRPEDPGYHYQLLWTAPEHLREEITLRGGSKKGDVYSYALIIQEILTRSLPFCGYSEEPQTVIERVTVREHPVFRPKVVPGDDTEEHLADLMRLCWEEIPAFRPNFVTIRDSLRKLNQGRPSNLVDQMVQMMEKYTNQLEELVDERTKQLADEQQRTQQLLCRMLPRSVAESLKRGSTIAPEAYPSVTIYFSDVVGFTSMAAQSSPLQVVNFLNDLYTCFDSVTESYDVYKVETIGDAYMVVSGLPVRNGMRHAGEICTMALDLLSAVRTFRIRHMPEKHLQLRCGVHTGSVVAGVVGIKMPRYCLFGDTVNYASRMESSGLALRIHVSPECKAVLDVLGGYHLEDRGFVTMKGKGEVRTYFLLGKDDFTKQLPDLSDAATLAEHEFK